MSDGMRREFTYLSSHATNRYFIPNWGNPIVAPRKKANDSIQRRGIRNPDTPHI